MALPKKTGLGRGLDAILTDTSFSSGSTDSINTLRISEIEPNKKQPRKDFSPEGLEALSESIQKFGIISPITVRSNDNGTYTIVAGERRWRAARMAGLSEIPVIVINADNKKAAEIALIENVQRSDLNPVEIAQGYQSLIDEYGLTQEEVSDRIGKSRSAVTNSLRLLILPDDVLDMLTSGILSTGHAKVLLGIKNKDDISSAAHTVITKDLSVRDTEKLVKLYNSPPKAEKELPAVDFKRSLEVAVQDKLGRTVKIVQNGTKSSINIGFSDNNDLDNVLRLLCGDTFVDSL